MSIINNASNEPDFTCLLLKGMQEVNECRRLRRQRRRSEDEAERVDYCPELTKFGSQDLGTETKDKQEQKVVLVTGGKCLKPQTKYTLNRTRNKSHTCLTAINIPSADRSWTWTLVFGVTFSLMEEWAVFTYLFVFCNSRDKLPRGRERELSLIHI